MHLLHSTQKFAILKKKKKKLKTNFDLSLKIALLKKYIEKV